MALLEQRSLTQRLEDLAGLQKQVDEFPNRYLPPKDPPLLEIDRTYGLLNTLKNHLVVSVLQDRINGHAPMVKVSVVRGFPAERDHQDSSYAVKLNFPTKQQAKTEIITFTGKLAAASDLPDSLAVLEDLIGLHKKEYELPGWPRLAMKRWAIEMATINNRLKDQYEQNPDPGSLSSQIPGTKNLNEAKFFVTRNILWVLTDPNFYNLVKNLVSVHGHNVLDFTIFYGAKRQKFALPITAYDKQQAAELRELYNQYIIVKKGQKKLPITDQALLPK